MQFTGCIRKFPWYRLHGRRRTRPPLQFLWTQDADDAIDTPGKLKSWLVGLELLGEHETVSEDDVGFHGTFVPPPLALRGEHGAPPDERTNRVSAQLNEAAP